MTNITIETWEEKVFVGERATVSLKELATQFGKSLPMMGKLLTEVYKFSWEQIGVPSVRYWFFSKEKIDLQIGFLVPKSIAEQVKEENGVTKTVTKQGKYAKYVHIGPYEKLHDAYMNLKNWFEKQGKEIDWETWFEAYVSDPTTVKPEDLVTEITVFISDKKKVKFEKIEEKVFVGERAIISQAQIKDQCSKSLPKMAKLLMGDYKLTYEQIGAPSIRYYSFTVEKIDLQIGFFVSPKIAEQIKEEDGVTKTITKGGNYAKYTHVGPYEGLSESWKLVQDWIKTQDKEMESENCYEMYVNDPTTVKPEEILTDILILTTEKRKRKEEIEHGGFCHIDISFEDKVRVQKFYSTLFGWTFKDFIIEDYFFFISPSGIDGGFEKKKIGSEAPSMLPYINVDSLDEEFYKKVEQVGGKITGEATIFEGQGGFIPIQDSEGNKLGLWSKKIQKRIK